jgi:hypothetical protein
MHIFLVALGLWCGLRAVMGAAHADTRRCGDISLLSRRNWA